LLALLELLDGVLGSRPPTAIGSAHVKPNGSDFRRPS
jgi:hypothetical protein